MPNILQPSLNSQKNLEQFIAQIQDKDIQSLLKQQLENILIVGALPNDSPVSQAKRSDFFSDVEKLIEKKLGGQDENQDSQD